LGSRARIQGAIANLKVKTNESENQIH
jgi:hypothetical protein